MSSASQQAGHALALGSAIAFLVVAVTGLVLLVVWFRRTRGTTPAPATRRLARIFLVLAVLATVSGAAQVALLLLSPDL